MALRWPGAKADLLATAERVTGADGRFDFGSWFAESFTVTAIAAGMAPAVVEIDLRDPTAVPPPDQLELALTPCQHRVVGTVFDGSGGPIAGASVARVRSLGTTTAVDGSYALCAVEGRQTLEVAADGYGSIALQVTVHGTLRRDVSLVPAGRIVGTATRRRDGTPVPNVLITATPADRGTILAAPAFTYADPAGAFELTDLAPGRFTVTGSTGVLKGSIVVVVVPAAVARAALLLADQARITGRIVSGGAPVAGARIVARSAERWSRSRLAISQSDGGFTLDEVPIGAVTFTADPYEVVSPSKLEVPADGLDGVVLDTRAMASLRGTVTRNGLPAARAVVSVTQNDLHAVCDGNGAYQLRGLGPGTYAVQATSESGDAATAGPTVVKLARGESRANVDLELGGDGAIAGAVVDQDDQPVEDAILAWTDEAGDSRRVTTDARGEYRVAGLRTEGVYRASVRASEQDRPLELIGDPPVIALTAQARRIDGVRIKVRVRRASIAGTVVDASGDPVADALVDAVTAPSDGAAVFATWLRLPTAVTAEDGTFTLRSVAEGQYAVRARAATGQGVTTPVAAGTHDAVVHVISAGSIHVTLAGFSAPPVVDAVNALGDNQKFYGTVTGDTAIIAGLPAGRYLVAAHNPREQNARTLIVAPGAATPVTLTSSGSASVQGTIQTFITGAPVRGMACVVYPTIDGMIGAEPTSLVSDAPASDASGGFVLDPVPAGSIAVYCYANAGMSAARAILDLARGQRATPTLLTVHLEPPAVGDLGIALDQGVPISIVAVRDHGPAAVAGLRARDVIVALAGHEIGQMSKGGVGTWIANLVPGIRAAITVKRGTTTLTLSPVATATLLAPN
ncbi:MAG: carboxypeptidase regulatory-like domain-containing protein [Kofleriaceae bacterium]